MKYLSLASVFTPLELNVPSRCVMVYGFKSTFRLMHPFDFRLISTSYHAPPPKKARQVLRGAVRGGATGASTGGRI